MTRQLWIATSVLALGLAGAGATGIGHFEASFAGRGLEGTQRSEESATEGRPVLVMTAQSDRSTNTVRLPGVIAAATEETRAFQVAGRLHERFVSLGDSVRKGDVLARLDDNDFRLALESAEAEHTAARAAFDKAGVSLRRVTSLQSDGWVSTRAFEETSVAFEEARSRVERAERAVLLARNNLTYATIRADADGVVTREFAEVGQVVASGQPILRIARKFGREAIVAVPEVLLTDIRDRRATVELWSQEGTEVAARLVELSPIADPLSRTFEARYRLETQQDVPALGMSATIRLTRPDAATSTKVPLSALHYGDDGASVWTVALDGRIERRHVSVAVLGSETVRIESGLTEGDRVVVIGGHKLTEGLRVRTIERDY